MTNRMSWRIDDLLRKTAKDSMARAMFFFFSNRFRDKRVGRSLIVTRQTGAENEGKWLTKIFV